MLHVVQSRKALDRVAKDLETAVARHKFGVLGTHDLRAKMAEKGVSFDHECRIFEVCNPIQAKKVLDTNLEISTALPCRISVYRSGETYKLATLLPTSIMRMLPAPGLEAVAQEVEDVVVAMMQEAA